MFYRCSAVLCFVTWYVLHKLTASIPIEMCTQEFSVYTHYLYFTFINY